MFPVASCDKTTIPAVEHATYNLYEGDIKDGFTLPLMITYTCNEGYSLQDSNRYVVKCEYSNGIQTGERELAVRAQWSSSNGIVCERGKSELISQK